MKAKYKVIIKKSALKELENVPKNYLTSIVVLIESLAIDPRPFGAEKLSGSDKYRVRKGMYRIIYSIHDSELIIWVVKISHRKDVYR